MFILKSKEQIAKAIGRAKARRPRVSFRGFGCYVVTGAVRDYVVTCERRNGLKVVDCECVAGQFGDVCLHAAAALSLHVGLAAQRATA
jgi:hypothetical protein